MPRCLLPGYDSHKQKVAVRTTLCDPKSWLPVQKADSGPFSGLLSWRKMERKPLVTNVSAYLVISHTSLVTLIPELTNRVGVYIRQERIQCSCRPGQAQDGTPAAEGICDLQSG